MTTQVYKNNGMNRSVRGMFVSAILAGTMIAGSVMPGCQKESDEAKAIRQAKLDFEYLAANHVAVADGSATKKSYEKIVSSLSKAASSSNAGEASAAKLLRARANARQAELLALQASNAERKVLDSIVVVRASLTQWKDLNSLATALTSYDPRKALDGLDQQITEKEKEIAEAESELTRLQGEMSALQASVSAAQASVQVERGKEAALRTQAIDKSQTERADLVTKANQAKRAGDGFDKQASDLQAQIAKLTPTVNEATLRLASLRSERSLLDIAKGEITRLVRINAEQSKKTVDGEKDEKGKTTRAGAKQMSENLTKQVARLRGLREKLSAEGDEEGGSGGDSGGGSGGRSLMTTYDEAKKLYESAGSEAGRAKGAPGAKGGPAELDVATYTHGLADLLMAKARGLQAYTSVMISLAEARPPLSDTSFAKEAADAKTAFDETVLAAQDAYTLAKTWYETAGSKVEAAQVKNRLDQIARTLATFDPRLPKQPDVAPDAAAPADGTETAVTPAKEGDQPTTPTPPSAPVAIPEGVEGEVVTALQKLMADLRKPDIAAFASGVEFKNQKQSEFFARFTPIQNKRFELDNAVTEHFGRSMRELAEEFNKQIGDSASLADMANQSADQRAVEFLRHADISDVQIAPSPDNPDEVFVTSKSGKLNDPIIMAKSDNGWKMHLDMPVPPGELTDTFLTEMGVAYDVIIMNVKANKYNHDAVAMFNDLFDEFTKARNRVLEGKK